MTIAVDRSEKFPIASEDDIVAVRKRVRTVAAALRLDSFATAAITTAASELTRNVWTHARGGEVGCSSATRDPGSRMWIG
jgi:serine/threonine-protein kinase RsbT